MKKADTYDVIVIGGGASGMMAAGTAAARGKRVLLIEKNKKLGEKLSISGGGRCNILNAEEDARTLLSFFGDAQKFLFSPFAIFGMKETWDFFESRGMPLMVEDRKRAFPQSESAPEVTKLLEEYVQEGKVEIRKNLPVIELVKRSGRITQVRTVNHAFGADSIILATGGTSHPETGSTGDALPWLEKLGHTVESPKLTVVPLKVQEKWMRPLLGISLPDAKIRFVQKGKTKFSERGRILMTHFGLSGPMILNLAARVDELLKEGVVTAYIDLFPDMNEKELDLHIQGLFEANKNKIIKNVLKDILPPGTSDVFLSRIKSLLPEEKVHSVTKEARKEMVEFFKNIPLTIPELMGEERAVVADGGIPLSEIDMKTMRSTVLKNLFITGDLLNITRPTGGYSLQLCWTTGYIAGKNA